MDIELVDILGIYSDHNRGQRGDIISTVFIGKIFHNKDKVEALAQDYAAAVDWINLEKLDNTSLALITKRLYQITKNGNDLVELFGRQRRVL